MSHRLKTETQLSSTHLEFIYRLLILVGTCCISSQIFAADDILNGTTDSLVATLKGSGMTYIYIAEGILSLAAYIKTKNILFLAGIVVVSIFFNVMLTVAGIA